MDEHVDKHLQARWTQDYPEYPLAGALSKPEFRSRYADPIHAASSGDIVALLTGRQWYFREQKKKTKERKGSAKKEKTMSEYPPSKQQDGGASLRVSGNTTESSSESNPHREESHARRKHEAGRGSRDSNKQSQERDEIKSGFGSLLQDVDCGYKSELAVVLTANTESPIFSHCTTPLIGFVARSAVKR